jgi:hypothetical protein
LRGNPQIGDDLLHVQTAYHRMRTGRSAKSSNIIALFVLHSDMGGEICALVRGAATPRQPGRGGQFQMRAR